MNRFHKPSAASLVQTATGLEQIHRSLSGVHTHQASKLGMPKVPVPELKLESVAEVHTLGLEAEGPCTRRGARMSLHAKPVGIAAGMIVPRTEQPDHPPRSPYGRRRGCRLVGGNRSGRNLLTRGQSGRALVEGSGKAQPHLQRTLQVARNSPSVRLVDVLRPRLRSRKEEGDHGIALTFRHASTLHKVVLSVPRQRPGKHHPYGHRGQRKRQRLHAPHGAP